MFIEVDSLNLLENFFERSDFVALINTYRGTLFHSFLFNAAVFILYSRIVCTLCQKRPNFLAYALASVLYCLAAQGPVFLLHALSPNTLWLQLENLLVTPPPYFLLMLYFLCTHLLCLDSPIRLATSSKLYLVIVAQMIVYYMLDAMCFYLMTNNSTYRMAVCFFANALMCSISCAVAYVVIRLIRKRKAWANAYTARKSAKLPMRGSLAVYIGGGMLLWMIVVSMMKIARHMKCIVMIETMLCVLLVICALVFVIGYMRDAIRVRQADLENETTHVDSLIGSIDNMRMLKHDMNNMLSVYDGYIQLRQWEKLETYHGALKQETKYAEDLLDINGKRAMDPIVRTLLTTKISEARTKGIYISVAISADTADIAMDALDLARVVGILLDNAIEETELTEKKSVLFSLQTTNDGKVLLSISNPTMRRVDLKEIVEKGYTTKPGHHGLGLFTLWNIVKKTPACRVSAECLENIITFYLELPVYAG